MSDVVTDVTVGRSARRRLAAAGAVAGAAVLAGTSVAFACTAVMGPLSLNPTNGAPGRVITTSASGIKVYPAKYAVHFANSTSGDCMSFRGVTTMKTIQTDARGSWSNVTMSIPSTAKKGVHSVCGMEVYPIKGGTGTTHETFTVT